MLGGFHSFGPGGYQQTPLADVLPITMGRLERQGFDEPISKDLQLPGPLKMRPTTRYGAKLPALQLAPAAENMQTWNELPPLDGGQSVSRSEGQCDRPCGVGRRRTRRRCWSRANGAVGGCSLSPATRPGTGPWKVLTNNIAASGGNWFCGWRRRTSRPRGTSGSGSPHAATGPAAESNSPWEPTRRRATGRKGPRSRSK